jgi:hypothetical protein
LNQLDRPLQELFHGKVSSIFVEAAEQARTRGNAHVAADLFFRAGRYDLLLSLLNHHLALEMVGGIENAYVRFEFLMLLATDFFLTLSTLFRFLTTH